MIFKMCTMTGSAHDQLHNFLVPMKAMFGGIESEDLATCKASFDALQKHLGVYEKYFVNEVVN